MRISTWVAALLLLGSCTTQADSDASPVISDFLSAYGGLERLRAFHAVRESGTIVETTAAGTRKGTILLEESAPNLSRLEVVFGSDRMVRCFDGDRGWYLFSGQPVPQYVDSDEQQKMTANDFAHPLIDYAKRGISVSLLSDADVEGHPAHRVQVRRRDGSIWIIFIDITSHWEVRRDYLEGGKVTTVQHLRGHRMVNGVLRPTVYETGSVGSKRRTTISLTDLEVDPEIPTSRFQPPS